MTDQDIRVVYSEDAHERRLIYMAGTSEVEIGLNRQGYGMLVVRTPELGELERYYGFYMALDHVAEVLECSVNDLPIPDEAEDFGI